MFETIFSWFWSENLIKKFSDINQKVMTSAGCDKSLMDCLYLSDPTMHILEYSCLKLPSVWVTLNSVKYKGLFSPILVNHTIEHMLKSQVWSNVTDFYTTTAKKTCWRVTEMYLATQVAAVRCKGRPAVSVMKITMTSAHVCKQHNKTPNF